jgi:hypothetical protein
LLASDLDVEICELKLKNAPSGGFPYVGDLILASTLCLMQLFTDYHC